MNRATAAPAQECLACFIDNQQGRGPGQQKQPVGCREHGSANNILEEWHVDEQNDHDQLGRDPNPDQTIGKQPQLQDRCALSALGKQIADRVSTTAASAIAVAAW